MNELILFGITSAYLAWGLGRVLFDLCPQSLIFHASVAGCWALYVVHLLTEAM